MSKVKDLAKIFEGQETPAPTLEETRKLNKVQELAARFNKWEYDADANLPASARRAVRTGPSPSEVYGMPDDIYGEESEDVDDEDGEDNENAEEEEEDAEGDGEDGEEEEEEEGEEEEEEEEEEAAAEEEAGFDHNAVQKQGTLDDINTKKVVTDSIVKHGNLEIESSSGPGELAQESNKFALSDADVDKVCIFMEIERPIVKHYGKGVDAFCFVKQNSGMLKPVRLFFHPTTGRLYIVRSKHGDVHSLFLHLGFFAEVDCSFSAMNYLIKDSVDKDLISSVREIEDVPHFVVWTSDKFRKNKRRKGLFKRLGDLNPKSRRSLIFIFAKREERDALCRLVEVSLEAHNFDPIPMTLAEDWSL